jgi:SAM-dependent methyltransferase
VNQEGKPASKAHLSPYDANYGNFQTELYEEIRREAFGEDIGQNSWLTASELDQFQEWLRLGPDKRLLDVACGAGGPALRMAKRTGCSVTGVDVHEQASLTMSALSSTDSRTPLPALVEERHFALDENGRANQGSLRNPFQARNSVRPMHLFDPQL